MKSVAGKLAIMTTVVLVAPFFTEPAFAQNRQRAQRPHSYPTSSEQRARFSSEEQRIIDQITRNGRASGN